MLEFGKLTVVEKTFTRTEGATRVQAYNGIKFRRFESEKGKKAAEKAGKAWTPFVEEQFVISNKAFETLQIENYALAEAHFQGRNFLLVVEDQDQVEPVAKFCRQSVSKGKPEKKGKLFTNEFLVENLTNAGKLTKEMGNQYLAITDVTAEFGSTLPSVVKAVFELSIDNSVKASDDAEETENATSAEAESDKF